ncbi:MAG: selenocysteine-specific translation elongation factor [bacterium]|nr:selenocysteine-specific translation elongation factor [bacterium]
MQQITLGTAGHIDHGKSALIQHLTGTDPDRLKEEKARGITLDLGFAHYQASETRRISFVDVPGHEGLVHNMLAGAQGFSGVLLCIAADEGPMPQTIEHFNLCRLLGIQRGLVVLTKVDLAERDLLDLLRLELAELFAGSFLEKAPVFEVSAKTGQGIEALKEALAGPLFDPQEPSGPFRLPIDRAFSLKGFGTVVSGTVLSGQADKNSALWLYPEEKAVKLRGIQSASEEAASVRAGMRAAFNLAALAKEEIQRGFQLAEPHSLIVTQRLGIWLEPLAQEAERIKPRRWVKVFAHAAQAMGQLIPIDSFEPSTGPLYCLLKLDRPLALRFGDRLILRGGSPERSLGGALSLALTGPLNRRSRALLGELLPQLHQPGAEGQIEALVRLAGLGGLKTDQLGPRLGLGHKASERAVAALLARQALLQPDKSEALLIAPREARRVVDFFIRALQSYHKNHPEALGAPAEYFFGKVGRILPPGRVTGLLAWALRQNLLAKTDNFYHLGHFKGGLSKAQQSLLDRALNQLAETAPAVPGLFHLAEALQVEREPLFKTLKYAEKQGHTVQIDEDLFYRTADLETLKEILRSHMAQSKSITVIQFKELVGLSRKNAIALLEFFDQQRFTFRTGDQRVLRE